MPRKKKGAQPGNLNAYKHGFYSEHFKSEEIRDLDAYLSNGLGDEIALMRVSAKRILELANTKDLAVEDQISILNAIGLATTRLAGLLRIKNILGTEGSESSNAISDALNEALKDWHRN